MSRPNKLTDEVQRKIVQAVQIGNYIETAAAYAGIDKSTLHRWLKRGEREIARTDGEKPKKVKQSEQPYVEFCNAVEKAMAESEVNDVTRLFKMSDDPKVITWRLERRFPERWGHKQKVSADVEHSGHIEHEDVSPKEKLNDQLQRIRKRKAKDE